jgi:hypothetical protein
MHRPRATFDQQHTGGEPQTDPSADPLGVEPGGSFGNLRPAPNRAVLTDSNVKEVYFATETTSNCVDGFDAYRHWNDPL